jgi:hypothetical protein
MSNLRLHNMLCWLWLALGCLGVAGCGVNFIGAISPDPLSEGGQLEQANALIDKKDYSGALSFLQDMDEDSNRRRVMMVAARLGNSGLDIWQILENVISGQTSSSGTDNFFNGLTDSVFGSGDVLAARLAAMRASLNDLQTAPNAGLADVSDTACFLGAMWITPLSLTATTELTSINTSLKSISVSDCSGVTGLQTGLDSVLETVADIQSVLQAISGCTFIDVSGTSGSLNSVETQISTLLTSADKGCEVPSCSAGDLACEALEQSCVREILVDSESAAVADDGKLTSCEVVQSCYNPSACFGS